MMRHWLFKANSVRSAEEDLSRDPDLKNGAGTSTKVAILAALFHRELVDQMAQDAIHTLVTLGMDEKNIKVVRVPGSLELPIAAKWVTRAQNYDGIIALGVVVRGETPHFEYVCQGATQGLVQVSLETNLPIMFGVLTTDTLEQAVARIQGPVERKGIDVAHGVAHMIYLAGHHGP